jgi:hypothetical protein
MISNNGCSATAMWFFLMCCWYMKATATFQLYAWKVQGKMFVLSSQQTSSAQKPAYRGAPHGIPHTFLDYICTKSARSWLAISLFMILRFHDVCILQNLLTIIAVQMRQVLGSQSTWPTIGAVKGCAVPTSPAEDRRNSVPSGRNFTQRRYATSWILQRTRESFVYRLSRSCHTSRLIDKQGAKFSSRDGYKTERSYRKGNEARHADTLVLIACVLVIFVQAPAQNVCNRAFLSSQVFLTQRE